MTVREVTSNQAGVHKHLEATVRKHLTHPWRKPLSRFSEDIFATVTAWLAATPGPLILDSGCGIGESSAQLARQFPGAKVLGFDRSESRLDKLSRKTEVPHNCLVVRADAEDLWRQLHAAGIFPEQHYLLFPNPYPKAAQLNQRWHGSPVLPYLLALGGKLEVRSNWQVYLEEFSLAVNIATGITPQIDPYRVSEPISAFEAKYAGANQPLWRLTVQLPTLTEVYSAQN
jgi:tRNA G46 methylase TrmB